MEPEITSWKPVTSTKMENEKAKKKSVSDSVITTDG